MIRHVIWDWNGTLLDDVDHAVSALNLLLDARAMPRLDRDRYREHFGFPVRNFYEHLGFDFGREDFVTVSESFIAHYKRAAETAQVHAEVRSTMSALATAGIAQSVVSAMELTMLRGMLHSHALDQHLTHIRGLDHLHATSKVALGVELMNTLGAPASETLFVGDTLHDLETANAMGCQCLLFVHGHQTKARLAAGGAQLIDALSEVVELVRTHATASDQ